MRIYISGMMSDDPNYMIKFKKADRDLKMAVKDSLERRHKKCPGRI